MKSTGFSQGNLIFNGSFENYAGTCPVSSPNGDFLQVVGWRPANSMPVHGMPHVDLYCPGTPTFSGCLPGPTVASDGSAYVGFHTRNIPQPYNEAIYQELPQPLTTGNNYRIEFDLMTCDSGIYTSGISDFCVYANNDTVIPACPVQNPSVVTIGCVPYNNIGTINWSHHQIDFIAPSNSNVIAFSGSGCFTTDIYYYLDNVILTETTGHYEIEDTPFDFSLFPQPANGNLFVEIKKSGNYCAEILDILGHHILNSNVQGLCVNKFHFNDTTSPGIYLLRISNEKSTKSKLVIIN